MALTIVPSIDLRGGRVVRLKQGDYGRQVNYDVDPLDVARGFAAAGAEWMHIVDLDGAKEGRPVQTELIATLIRATGLKVEIGGGIRTTDDVKALLDAGAARVVVGTRAMEDWPWFTALSHDPAFARKLVLAVDAKEGMIATRGWTETSARKAADVARDVSDWPLGALLYTDVAKDGMLQGPNIEHTRELALAGKVPVIASGGVGNLDHIRELTKIPVWGVIVGRSLYEGKVDLAAAIQLSRELGPVDSLTYNSPQRVMDDRLIKLADKARQLPKAPGVYLMKDDKGRVIYVGKSASLRDRVGSYFQPSTRLEHKKSGLLDLIVDFDTIQTESEVEALLAENRLIKDIQPRYNARLLDDKTFPYLMITTGDEFPGVYITRVPQARGTKLYGPFTSGYALKEAVTLLQRAFKFRTCHLEISEADEKRRFFRPCLLYPIKQCTAPCAAKISKTTYAEDIGRLIRFLDGGKKTILRDLEKEMIQASKELNFERAARLRDEIKALNALGARAKKGDQEFWQPEAFVHDPKQGLVELQQALGLPEAPRIVEGIDIAHLQGGEMVGSKVCFIDGVPFKDGYRRYKIKHGQGNNDYLSIQEVVSRRYREAGQSNELYPDVILIDGGLGQLHAALEVFKTMDVKPPMVISLAKKEELVYTQAKSEPIRLTRNHLGLKLLQYIRDEAHRFAQHYHHILRRKSQLEEDVKQGRRPPRAKKKPSSQLAEDLAKAPGPESPHWTHLSLPVLQPAEPTPTLEPGQRVDSEDAMPS